MGSESAAAGQNGARHSPDVSPSHVSSDSNVLGTDGNDRYLFCGRLSGIQSRAVLSRCSFAGARGPTRSGSSSAPTVTTGAWPLDDRPHLFDVCCWCQYGDWTRDAGSSSANVAGSAGRIADVHSQLWTDHRSRTAGAAGVSGWHEHRTMGSGVQSGAADNGKLPADTARSEA